MKLFPSERDGVGVSRRLGVRGGWLWAGVVILWVVAAVGGSLWLGKFSFSPGESPEALEKWPEGSRLERTAGEREMVMFLHPWCPCSRASVEELSVVMARAGEVRVQAVFVTTEGEEKACEESGLWRRVQELPGVTARMDVGGREAGLFRSATSGDAFLYDEDGRLVFRGGLTVARGHSGDNFGVDAVVGILKGNKGDLPKTGVGELARGPVFGCALGGAMPEVP